MLRYWNMKKLLAILVLSLCFITSSQSEDIRDFQMEGMSIGDSLLDYFSRSEIESHLEQKDLYKSFNTTTFSSARSKKFESKLKTYNFMQVEVRRDDKNYPIIAMDAANIEMENENFDMNNCIKEAKKVVNEFKKMFGKSTKYQYDKMKKHKGDKSGKSITDSHFFIFKDDSFVNVGCNDWSEEVGWFDRLFISLVSKEMHEILDLASQQ